MLDSALLRGRAERPVRIARRHAELFGRHRDDRRLPP
jgi:hypothetical protein